MSELSHLAHSKGLAALGETAPDVFPDESGQAEAIANTPGQRLSEARKSRGLTISDVSHAIKFSPRQIEAIESDDFDKLAGANFARGFMRSYAKFLHLDPQPLLEILDRQSPQADAMIRVPQDTGASLPQAGKRPALVPYMLLLALLAAVVVAVIFWPFAKSIPVADHSMETPPTVVAQPATVPAEPVPVPAAAAGPSPNLQYAPSMQAAPAAQSAQAGQPDAMAQAVRQMAPGQHQLMFTFAGKSWVEVRDATQNIIFAQNNDPGSHQVVNGKPPFALVIGNASAVQLQYDERQIDLRPYTKVDVARMNLE